MAGVRNRIKSLVPDAVLLGQLARRRAAAWEKAGLVFVHVPKNGGTSINDALFGRFMGHARVRDIERVRPDLLAALPSLAVTRNPWARAYSAWSFATAGAAMRDGAQIRHPERYRGAAFASFERFVLDWLPGRDLEREDYVFRPQVHFLLDRQGAVGVRQLGRIEDPESYLPWLEEVLGRRVEVGHLNRSADPARYRDAYSGEMAGVVARAYAADLERFAYDF